MSAILNSDIEPYGYPDISEWVVVETPIGESHWKCVAFCLQVFNDDTKRWQHLIPINGEPGQFLFKNKNDAIWFIFQYPSTLTKLK